MRSASSRRNSDVCVPRDGFASTLRDASGSCCCVWPRQRCFPIPQDVKRSSGARGVVDAASLPLLLSSRRRRAGRLGRS